MPVSNLPPNPLVLPQTACPACQRGSVVRMVVAPSQLAGACLSPWQGLWARPVPSALRPAQVAPSLDPGLALLGNLCSSSTPQAKCHLWQEAFGDSPDTFLCAGPVPGQWGHHTAQWCWQQPGQLRQLCSRQGSLLCTAAPGAASMLHSSASGQGVGP